MCPSDTEHVTFKHPHNTCFQPNFHVTCATLSERFLKAAHTSVTCNFLTSLQHTPYSFESKLLIAMTKS